MPLLRFAYALALTLWLGGMIVLGAVVAPALFQTLSTLEPETGRALAGEAFGVALTRFHYLAYGAGTVMLVAFTAMALLGPRPRSFAIRLGIIGLMLATAAYSGVIVLGEIDSIQREIATPAAVATNGSIDAAAPRLPSSLPENDPRQRRPDIGKARELLGWQPTVELEPGLRSTIAYFRHLLANGLESDPARRGLRAVCE
jgi:hypothetical protein